MYNASILFCLSVPGPQGEILSYQHDKDLRKKALPRPRGTTEGSAFSIQHLFCCFASYSSLLRLRKVIQPKANEIDHHFYLDSSQDWLHVT